MITNRRAFLGGSLAAVVGATLARQSIAFAQAREKLPVAGITTTYGPNTHADVILTKILKGYKHDGGEGPNLKLTSVFVDQQHPKDISAELAKQHDFRIAKSIDEALTGGTDELKVSGVFIIGEHGDYPNVELTNQKMYPRRKFFDEVVATFRRVGRVVPVFNDKHLSYNWADAKHMVETAEKMKIPFMAGSSVPVAWRVPPLELKRDCEIEEALAIGYGPMEGYGFHTIEGLQCMVERRRGGETGVKRIDVVKGPAIWEAEKAGRWSRKLLDATLAATPVYRAGEPEKLMSKDAAFFFIEYLDGLKATVAMANGVTASWAFAANLKGQAEPAVTMFAMDEDAPYGHFAPLVKAVEHMIHTGKPAYPVERTLLTTGILDAAMHAYATGEGKDTPHLAVTYQPSDWPFAEGKPPERVKPMKPDRAKKAKK